MRISLNEISQIEGYLQNTGSTEEGLLVEAKLTLSKEFGQKVSAQKAAYALIKNYGKAKLLNDVKIVEDQLFKLPKYNKFRSAILRLFTK